MFPALRTPQPVGPRRQQTNHGTNTGNSLECGEHRGRGGAWRRGFINPKDRKRSQGLAWDAVTTMGWGLPGWQCRAGHTRFERTVRPPGARRGAGAGHAGVRGCECGVVTARDTVRWATKAVSVDTESGPRGSADVQSPGGRRPESGQQQGQEQEEAGREAGGRGPSAHTADGLPGTNRGRT